MFARVTIFGKSHPGALSIPREALIRGQETDRVVVALGDGNYTVHEVMSGIESGDWVEIIAGLEVGDEVVTSAQFLISHGPIEALGWAPMTMDFDVLPGANLDTITIGQSIHFSLSQSDVGDYVISIIHQPEPDDDEGASDESENNHEQEGAS